MSYELGTSPSDLAGRLRWSGYDAEVVGGDVVIGRKYHDSGYTEVRWHGDRGTVSYLLADVDSDTGQLMMSQFQATNPDRFIALAGEWAA